MSEILNEHHHMVYESFAKIADENKHDAVILYKDQVAASIHTSRALEECHDEGLDAIDDAIEEGILPEDISYEDLKFLQVIAFCNKLEITVDTEYGPEEYDASDAELIVDDAMNGVEYSSPQLNKWSLN